MMNDVQCQIVATRESGSPVWSFYLVNQAETSIESAELTSVKYEFGDQYAGGECPHVTIANLPPGERALVWKDDGSSEMRTDLWLRIDGGWYLFEFPKLYRQRGTTLTANPAKMPKPPDEL